MKNNAKPLNEYDLYFNKQLQDLKEEELKRAEFLTSTGISRSEIQNQVRRLFDKFNGQIYGEILEEGFFPTFNDPFANAIITQFEQLKISHKSDAIFVLASQFEKIKLTTSNFRLWGSDELINRSTIEIINFIAFYYFLKETIEEYDSEESFSNWQNQSRLDARGYISIDKFEQFLQFEKGLFNNGFINHKGVWQKSKKELVTCIIFLIKHELILKKWLKSSQSYSDLRTFFEHRYLETITKEFQKNRRSQISENKIKPFEFIIDSH